MTSVILGDWTHRRGDPGGARAVAAEIERPRPSVAWSWRPEHGGRVDQVRVAVRAKDKDSAMEGLAKLVETCDECHEAFRDQPGR